jgi:hypothetical protein
MMTSLRLISIFILLIGLGLFSYSLTMDYYKDKRAAEELISKGYDLNKSDYYKKEAKLRTHKLTFMDLGAGIAIASLVFLGFFVIKHIKTISDLIQIKSINKTTIFVLSNVLWLILIPGTYWYYSFRGARGDYPPFADSIGIPIFTQVPLLLILMIPLNLFIGLTMIKSTIPTQIFIRAYKYNGKAIFWELFFGFWLLINLFCLIVLVIDGDHFSIPVNMFLGYVLLTLRAGQINRWTTENKINASAQHRL